MAKFDEQKTIKILRFVHRTPKWVLLWIPFVGGWAAYIGGMMAYGILSDILQEGFWPSTETEIPPDAVQNAIIYRWVSLVVGGIATGVLCAGVFTIWKSVPLTLKLLIGRLSIKDFVSEAPANYRPPEEALPRQEWAPLSYSGDQPDRRNEAFVFTILLISTLILLALYPLIRAFGLFSEPTLLGVFFGLTSLFLGLYWFRQMILDTLPLRKIDVRAQITPAYLGDQLSLRVRIPVGLANYSLAGSLVFRRLRYELNNSFGPIIDPYNRFAKAIWNRSRTGSLSTKSFSDEMDRLPSTMRNVAAANEFPDRTEEAIVEKKNFPIILNEKEDEGSAILYETEISIPDHLPRTGLDGLDVCEWGIQIQLNRIDPKLISGRNVQEVSLFYPLQIVDGPIVTTGRSVKIKKESTE